MHSALPLKLRKSWSKDLTQLLKKSLTQEQAFIHFQSFHALNSSTLTCMATSQFTTSDLTV